jgi:hypothetical protein
MTVRCVAFALLAIVSTPSAMMPPFVLPADESISRQLTSWHVVDPSRPEMFSALRRAASSASAGVVSADKPGARRAPYAGDGRAQSFAQLMRQPAAFDELASSNRIRGSTFRLDQRRSISSVGVATATRAFQFSHRTR